MSRSLEGFLILIHRQHLICRNEHSLGSMDKMDRNNCKVPYHFSHHEPQLSCTEVLLHMHPNIWDASARVLAKKREST